MTSVTPPPPVNATPLLSRDSVTSREGQLPGLLLNTVLQATIIKGGTNQVLLEVNGQRFTANTDTPVVTGQKLTVLANETSSRIILTVVTDPLQARLTQSLHQFGEQWSTSPLANHLYDSNSPLFQGLSADARQAVTTWLSYLRNPITTPLTGKEVEKLPHTLGLTMEKNLIGGEKESFLSLKGALLDAVHILKGQENTLGQYILKLVGREIGEQSQLFKQLDPVSRETILHWLGQRADSTTSPAGPGDLQALARSLEIFQTPASKGSSITTENLVIFLKTALRNSAQILQENTGTLAAGIGKHLELLVAGQSHPGTGPELRSAALSWMALLEQPPAGPIKQEALTQLARLLGLTPEKEISVSRVLQNAAGELAESKGVVSGQAGSMIRQILEQGGIFLKELEPDARAALHAMLNQIQNPISVPMLNRDLLILARLLGLKPEHFSSEAGAEARASLERIIQETRAVQAGKGDALSDITRQLQQIEFFQLSQLKMDQQNIYFLPLPLPFLEQGYLIAEENPGHSDRPDTLKRTISLHLSMQNLGNMRIDLHHHPDGLFIRFALDSEAKSAFAESFRPELEQALTQFSVKGIAFDASAEPPATAIIKKMLSGQVSFLDTRI